MGKPKSKREVVDYRLSLHFGVCLGPIDYFRAVRINEKDVWRGQQSTAGAVTVVNRELFGGPEKEGGVEGVLHFMPGKADQLAPAALSNRHGRAPQNFIAYRGLATIFMCGIPGAYGGIQGWLWGSNNPIVAQNVEVEVTNSAKGLNPAIGVVPNPDQPDKPDTNPAHIIFEVATDPDDGSMRPEDVDTASFNAAAQVLFNERFGLSMTWFRPMENEAFIQEVQDHINAATYTDPDTGLYTIKLIRNDYDPATLFEINADNAILKSFSRRMFGEMVNEVVVTWTNPENEQEETITVQDLALGQFQSKVSSARNHYGIRHKKLAEEVAWRDLRSESAPLASVEVEIDRSGWNLKPAQPVRVYFVDPENPAKTIDIIARCGEVTYGKPGAEYIPLTLTEDIFSLDRPVARRAVDSAWVDPSVPPTPMVAAKGFTLPLFMVLSPEYQDRVTDLVYPEVLAGVLGYHPSYDALDFELVDPAVDPTGAIALARAGTKTITERGQLMQSLAAEATSNVLWSYNNALRAPVIGSFALVGDVETTQEIMLVRSWDGFQFTVDRGVLDTVPRAWPSGTPVWFLNPNARFVDDNTIRAEGETVEYRLLTRTSQGQLNIEEAAPITATMTGRPHYPLRPADVRVNNVPIQGTINVAGVNDIVLTWANRNRLLEDGQAVRWGDPTVAPEYRQRTIIAVTDTNGNIIRQYNHLWNDTTFTIPKAWFARYATVRLLIYSERDGLTSLQALGYTINGLANDASAAEPPAAPVEGVPPPPVLAPSPGVFTSAGGTMPSGAGGGTLPAIFVRGRRESSDMIGLSIRYCPAEAEVTSWNYHPSATLDERPLDLPIPVGAKTEFRIEVAYISSGGIVGLYRALNNATSGAVKADDLAEDSPIYGVIDASSEAIAAEILRGSLYRTYTDSLLHFEGEPVATLAQRLTEEFDTFEGTYAGSIDLLGAKNPQGTGFILNAASVFIPPVGGNPQEALVSSLQNLRLKTAQNESEIIDYKKVADGFASAKTLLVVNGHVTGIYNQNDGTTGELSFRADKWRFVDPNGNNPRVPFSYDGQTLILTNTRIDGNLIVTGSITNAAMQKNTVIAMAVSDFNGTITMTGTTPKSLREVWISVEKADSPVKLSFSALMLWLHNASGSFTAYLDIYRYDSVGNGQLLRTRQLNATGDTYDAVSGFTTFFLTDKPGIGLWRYEIRGRTTTNNMTIQTATDPYLEAQEYRNTGI